MTARKWIATEQRLLGKRPGRDLASSRKRFQVAPEMTNPHPLQVRLASVEDVPLMEQCRRLNQAGPADERMTAYFNGVHHPHQALLPRVGYLALSDNSVLGYIAGHLTARFGYAAELQYLFVALPYRRQGVGRQLVQELARWCVAQQAARVCVCVERR